MNPPVLDGGVPPPPGEAGKGKAPPKGGGLGGVPPTPGGAARPAGTHLGTIAPRPGQGLDAGHNPRSRSAPARSCPPLPAAGPRPRPPGGAGRAAGPGLVLPAGLCSKRDRLPSGSGPGRGPAAWEGSLRSHSGYGHSCWEQANPASLWSRPVRAALDHTGASLDQCPNVQPLLSCLSFPFPHLWGAGPIQCSQPSWGNTRAGSPKRRRKSYGIPIPHHPAAVGLPNPTPHPQNPKHP